MSTPPQPDAPQSDAGAVAFVGDRSRSYFRSRGSTPLEMMLVIVLGLAIFVPGIWTYTLVDPWETHYGEVGRRMLQDDDWVHMDWSLNEGFRSKPVFTFWLIASSMKTLDVGDAGGFSGEMVSSELTMFAVRLPFVLFGVLGLALLWWMLARLVNRRVAWLSYLIVATTPFYFFISRQAITDMPLVGCLMGSIACFALAIHSGDAPLRSLWKRINSFHILLAVLIAFVGWQAVYYFLYFSRAPLAHGVNLWHPEILLPGAMLLGLAAFVVWAVWLQPTRTARQVYMYWFYVLVGISVLGKGPPALGIAGVMCLFYLLLTGQWRLLTKVEIPRGILIVALVVVPWHVGMFLADGRLFLQRYFVTHLFRRAAVGVHGERGTFNFFASQIGIGFWPWVGLLPAALAGVVNNVTARTREGRVRLLIGIWAISAVALFIVVQTKFHHYIFPAIPALGVLVAFFLDDLLRGRVRRTAVVALASIAIILLITRDLMAEQKQLIELFVYRYNRPWPSADPYAIDVSDGLLGFGLAFSGLMLLLIARRLHRLAVIALGVVALLWAMWGMHVYMPLAGKHWGMREAIRTYYDQRQIHGVDLHYYGLRQLADEWDDVDCEAILRDVEGEAPPAPDERAQRCEYMVESHLPEHFTTGQPMTIDISVGGDINNPDRELSLQGTVSRLGENRFWIDLPEPELERLDPHIRQGLDRPAPRRSPWRQVDADRLIAWQLYWRGEHFWSGDEIWGPRADYKTAFKQTDNKAFLAYLEEHGRPGYRYFVVTESGRAPGLRNILPSPRARETYEIIDTTSNKFSLASFVL